MELNCRNSKRVASRQMMVYLPHYNSLLVITLCDDKKAVDALLGYVAWDGSRVAEKGKTMLKEDTRAAKKPATIPQHLEINGIFVVVIWVIL